MKTVRNILQYKSLQFTLLTPKPQFWMLSKL
jgi:hypothetical protein